MNNHLMLGNIIYYNNEGLTSLPIRAMYIAPYRYSHDKEVILIRSESTDKYIALEVHRDSLYSCWKEALVAKATNLLCSDQYPELEGLCAAYMYAAETMKDLPTEQQIGTIFLMTKEERKKRGF